MTEEDYKKEIKMLEAVIEINEKMLVLKDSEIESKNRQIEKLENRLMGTQEVIGKINGALKDFDKLI